jgi:hypothetical protein
MDADLVIEVNSYCRALLLAMFFWTVFFPSHPMAV